jgi:hypothetical protein
MFDSFPLGWQGQDKVGKKQGAEQLVVNAKKSQFEETW